MLNLLMRPYMVFSYMNSVHVSIGLNVSASSNTNLFFRNKYSKSFFPILFKVYIVNYQNLCPSYCRKDIRTSGFMQLRHTH